MKLIQVKNGLLEAENFFLASSFADFAGESNITRDIKTGKLKLISNNKIERKFDYKEFVIEVEKENFSDIKDMDYSMLYLGNSDHIFGIKDLKSNEQNRYWKILKKDNYIQAYSSNDGKSYTNIGGMEFIDPLTKQGFMKYSDEDFILNNYKVYANPYVTIQNFPENTLCELYDLDNNLIKTRLFNSDMECKVFIDSNMRGYFTFKDTDGKMIYTSNAIQLQYGDMWVFSPYNFEIIYHGNVVTNVSPAMLQDLEELITIKNIGDKDYNNIKIGTETPNNDLIQLSFDGINYTDSLTIDSIKQSESKGIYVKITKNAENHNFAVRDFHLVISE
ncbi:hypothetical protein [Clostridium botulinum]|uniref:Uncharacterized protein n=1 Tax=Clostridium botulinum TaxID=1491 RepID=A0A6B4G5A4_CLOBO|nr:hypothetical protein [Clostridium botulinum]MBN3370942.1 hypothetical protein [Clostridium botulinum]MBN3376498.1 hypothetical protein [Clostridium botulinum]MBN3382755.1 hypothetical protein [Clostridium botulinum]MBN3390309.1 hypothetical protein [Clostridium botulinum]MBN3431009.1 hypothetical protein [Clostridium botulinum]